MRVSCVYSWKEAFQIYEIKERHQSTVFNELPEEILVRVICRDPALHDDPGPTSRVQERAGEPSKESVRLYVPSSCRRETPACACEFACRLRCMLRIVELHR